MFINSDGEPNTGLIVKFSVGFILLVILIFGSFRFISAGQVGVVTRFGAVNRVVSPGLVFKIPLIEGVVAMETRTQKEQADSEAASKDLQTVHSTIALNYHLRGEKAVQVYQNVGQDYNTRIIDPALQEAFKATTAKFTAEELISKREAVKLLAYDELKSRLDKYNIVVDDFNIVNFDFSNDFNNAIEQKQVAQQNLERAKLEAQTAITQANGQAAAQAALKNNGSLTAEYLEYLAVNKWNGVLPLYTSGTPFITVPTK
jgi:regulator of protease activity HflC (stomatin/prohibitin superfamily)